MKGFHNSTFVRCGAQKSQDVNSLGPFFHGANLIDLEIVASPAPAFSVPYKSLSSSLFLPAIVSFYGSVVIIISRFNMFVQFYISINMAV